MPKPTTGGGPRPQLRLRRGSGEQEPATRATEITIITGDRYRVQGAAKDVERAILDAARGSILQFAWLIDAETGEEFAINPEGVLILRASGS